MSIENASAPPELSEKDFRRISRLVHERCGINLQPGKEALVRSRLARRLQGLGMASFGSYIDFVQRAGSRDELPAMIDALTTNKTSFFREPQHFDFLRRRILPQLQERGEALRFWSAGCSTGEEAYTLAIILNEGLAAEVRGDCRILATDISRRALNQARHGIYEAVSLEDVPAEHLKRYFRSVGTEKSPAFGVGESLRCMVRFARLNLMEHWPMSGRFDAIFCRNVMIYFDLPTRQRLARRFWEILRPGGHLFVGHSESLTQCSPEFRYIEPAVYGKNSK